MTTKMWIIIELHYINKRYGVIYSRNYNLCKWRYNTPLKSLLFNTTIENSKRLQQNDCHSTSITRWLRDTKYISNATIVNQSISHVFPIIAPYNYHPSSTRHTSNNRGLPCFNTYPLQYIQFVQLFHAGEAYLQAILNVTPYEQ